MRNELKNIPMFIPPSSSLINLAMNENQYANWNEVLLNEYQSIINQVNLSEYGSSKHDLLVKNYAGFVGLNENQILVAPGSDGLIPFLINTLTNNKILTIDPDFFRYQEAGLVMNKENISIELDDNYVDNIIKTTKENNIEMILISNPNNPLGILHTKTDLIKIIENTNAYVLVDEAYIEYCDMSIKDEINNYDNLIVLRTLSKAWGLAGLRVGFALANPTLIDYLKVVQGPFTLCDINGLIAAKTIEKQADMEKMVIQTNLEKTKFIEFLKDYHIDKIYESNGNFVYLEVDDNLKVASQLLKHNIAVSKFKTTGLRITIGTPKQMDCLKEALKTILKGV